MRASTDQTGPTLAADRVWDVLRTIDDPEMPVSIVDLGIVHAVRIRGAAAEVDITPTFIGCPALDMIRSLIQTRLRAMGADRVTVNHVNEPAWTVDRISEVGRAALRAHGVTVPGRTGAAGGNAARPAGLVPLGRPGAGYRAGAEVVHCPYCGAAATLESAFGPTRCRMIYYCGTCRNSFEHLRRV
jgi:ring-1,2-phenylacetyl-CoA epoxidase subunit PaaD